MKVKELLESNDLVTGDPVVGSMVTVYPDDSPSKNFQALVAKVVKITKGPLGPRYSLVDESGRRFVRDRSQFYGRSAFERPQVFDKADF